MNIKQTIALENLVHFLLSRIREYLSVIIHQIYYVILLLLPCEVSIE